jgi:hypothetical protein
MGHRPARERVNATAEGVGAAAYGWALEVVIEDIEAQKRAARIGDSEHLKGVAERDLLLGA